ncbi:MAG: hypothetical protein RR256_05125, partial [Bacteroidales bacterium]
QKSFSSFGVACDKIYLACIPENFKTEEDVAAFVSTNKEYLQIVSKNGEKVLEPINYKNRYRYLANLSKLFQVGDDIYKVFEEIIIKTSTKNRAILEQITESNLDAKLLSSSEISVFYSQKALNNSLSGTKDCASENYCTPNQLLGHSFNDKQKESLHVRVSLTYTAVSGLDFLESVEYVVRPYKKVLGIWYWRKADISMDLSLRAYSYRGDNGTWGFWDYSNYVSLKNERVIEGNYSYNNRQLSNIYYGPSFKIIKISATNSLTKPFKREEAF